MLQTIIELADGTRIGSGGAGIAIVSAELTQAVNAGTELTLGSVCAAMVQVTLFAPDGCPLGPGDSFILYKTSASGQLHRLGSFTAEQPQWCSGHRVKITAYDAVAKLDADLTAWLAGLNSWPYTFQELAQLVCARCGVTLADEALPNGELPVGRFTPGQVTGRDIMRWIGQVAGRFCTADEAGILHFGWYGDAPISYGPEEIFGLTVTEEDGALTLSGDVSAEGELILTGTVGSTGDGGDVTLWGADRRWYRQGGLQVQNYETAPISAVWLRADESDTGVIYPDGQGENVYIIQGNPLLSDDGDLLLIAAQTLYEGLGSFCHTPMTLTAPADLRIRAGHLVRVTDSRGRTHTGCVMTRVLSGATDRLTGVGSATLSSTTAVNNRAYRDLTGRVLRLRTDVDGVRAEHEDLAGRVGTLELTADGILAQVSRQSQVMEDLKASTAQLSLEAGAIRASVETIEENGVSRVQNTFGLTIDGSDVTIHRSGSEMTNRLNELGMSVVRGQGQAQTTMLSADADGVVATDVSVRNYLCIGTHARLEDYADGADTMRTACFWREEN